jgi:TolB-like protein/Tfp pilus assembly protein PilF/tRNA A-37 threonylcarbamoyl transferase component Bud32
MALQPGDKLGPYEIIAPIGEGGMGEVYKARDPRLNRIIAIKRLKGQHTARFEQEAHAIAALNHPNICQIHDIGPDYLVMEYVEGKPLSGPLGVEEALKLAVQIAGAMEEAHSKGILHRDLKPANILVTLKGSAKLLDFGLAKLMTEADADATKTIEGTVLGTAAYMSPEQAQGKPLDERSDIFSFGTVLYEMLSGKRAFGGISMLETLNSVVRSEPAPLDSPASSVVRSCLAKRPSERFQIMAEVRAALEHLTTKPAERRPSIAVLPFANMSRDPDDEYFSDGLAEEILNALAHMRGLKVIARTSSFAFRGKEQDITKIAEALGVRTILEGSVRRAGRRIRVTAQLISAEDGSHLWSERYDRELADVFAVQEEIAHAISAALRVEFSDSAETSPVHLPNLRAYEAFLKARHHYARYSPEAIARAMECLKQAISLDPQFAIPHYWLSRCYIDFALYSTMPIADAVAMARSEAYKAVDLDASLAEPRTVLGVVAALFDYDWAEADQQYRQAMARQPVPPQVGGEYGWFLTLAGRPEEGAAEIERVLLEDPVNPMFHFTRALCLHAAGREVEAAEEFLQVLELEANHLPSLYWLTRTYAAQDRIADALAYAEKAYLISPWNTEAIGGLAGLLLRTGDRSRALELLGKLGDGQAYGAPIGFANCYLLGGEPQKAADWIEKAIEQRHPLVGLYLRSTLTQPMRPISRWLTLAKRINLPA